MIGLLQRVSQASVTVETECVGEIAHGLLVLVAVERHDRPEQADRLLERLLGYRVFADTTGRMNVSLTQHGGGLLLVPQFTLAADTARGTRAGFSRAADPQMGERLFGLLLERARERHTPVAAGRFGATMQVASVNEGPVTFWLRAPPGTD